MNKNYVCNNRKCRYHDTTMIMHCARSISAEDDRPYALVCRTYMPPERGNEIRERPIQEGKTVKQINTLEDLNTAAKNRQSVVFGLGSFSRPMPAAVFLNMSGITILGRIHLGVYIYEKPKKFKWRPSGFTRKAVNTGNEER